MALVEIANLTAGYGEIEILHEVDFAMQDSDNIITVIGPNGAGKSTFLKALMGFVDRKAGRIRFQDEDITGLRSDQRVRRGIAYVPQLEHTFPSLTVEENVRMGGYTLKGEELARRRQEVFELFPRLGERRKQYVRTMSGGERQMLAMARALMTDPRLLLLDEPSAALSPNMAETVFQKVEEIKDQGKSIIIVEQDAQRALQISDRGYVLVNGQNAFDGEAETILNDEKIREAYLGSWENGG
jgi:ABC-type branched-subunit amino acid transport system ATPase component